MRYTDCEAWITALITARKAEIPPKIGTACFPIWNPLRKAEYNRNTNQEKIVFFPS